MAEFRARRNVQVPTASDFRQLCPELRVSNVMGNHIIDAGNRARPKADAGKICGAMAEQRQADGRNENESAPQKFVHLVGYRDPNARRAPWVRPRPIPPKS